MTIRCPNGHENPDGSLYCDECGAPLDATAPAPVQQMAVDPNAQTVGQDPTFIPQQAQPMQPAQPVQPMQSVQPAPDMTDPNAANDMNNMGGADMSAGANAATVSPDVNMQPAPIGQATANALQARLIVEADNQEFDLSGKDNIVIGREDAVSNIYPDVDLTPHGGEEGGVSRLHAHIFNDNGQYMLEDENSTNFTFLNRQRLSPKTPTPLHDNDEIRLGRVLLRFKTP